MMTAIAEGATVPVHWRLEIANAMLIAQRRKRIDAAGARVSLDDLEKFEIAIDEVAARKGWPEILALGEAYNLTAYDAAYLELCIRRDLPLATLDKRLRDAARNCGVSLFT
jgi:predicted nucleic acid-binding protein